MSRSSILFLLSLALLSLTAPAGATVIYVSGDQTGTWSADTVIVTADVRVPPGQSLTILPGVEVLFSVYCKLIVDNGATLRAVGTPSDSIRFDVLPPDTAWHGIRFLSASDSSRLEYCHLTHGFATGSGEDSNGGAIYCSNSSPTINYNNISGNMANSWGGGIMCSSSSPTISENTISANSAVGNGGGIFCEYSSPCIIGNTISGNSASISGGGGIVCFNSSPTISSNMIRANSTSSSGGGILCSSSSPNISGNTIIANSASNSGGGISCGYYSSPTISSNTISGNSATYYFGGGIDCWTNSNPIIRSNTISGNSAPSGGGIYSQSNSTPTLDNCILWGNTTGQIYGTATVTYSDIQGGYAGTGNISVYPAFVDTAQGDYRLQWGSPCIDTGDPNPIYNDPDGTRADMGAWYYDQSLPVRVLLTPYNAPIQIPAVGGSFQYAIQATNIENATLSALVWCNATMPSGSSTGYLLGPVTISLASGQTLSRVRTQVVPAGAPAGMYHYNAFAVAAGYTSEDNFVFTKLGFGNRDSGFGGWANTGEDFTTDVGARRAVPAQTEGAVRRLADAPTLHAAMPNPFNPITVLSYQLPVAGQVRFDIYNPMGRLMETLVDGWRDAGDHQITFDGSGLPSGIYFAKLKAGDFSQVQKMVLMK